MMGFLFCIVILSLKLENSQKSVEMDNIIENRTIWINGQLGIKGHAIQRVYQMACYSIQLQVWHEGLFHSGSMKTH